MKILLLTAFRREAAVLIEQLTALAPLAPYPLPGVASCLRAPFATGEVYCACTGLGTEEAAITASALLLQLAPDIIIMGGTAGAVHPDYQFGDIVLGKSVIQLDLFAIHDLIAHTPFADCLINPNTQSPFETTWQADARLLALARQTELPRLHDGQIFSSNSFPAPAALFETMVHLGGGAIEMESAGVFRAAGRLGAPPTLTVRVISNLLDEQGRDRGTPDGGVEYCASRLADLLLHLVPRLLKDGLT
jgi:nucleoside phosphorylase